MTSSVEAPSGLDEAAMEAAAARSPRWLAQRRREAWATFCGLPAPSSRRDEDWRRTDIGHLDIGALQRAQGPTPRNLRAAMHQRCRQAVGDAAFLVDAPGGSVDTEGADTLLAQGVIVGSLAEAAVRHPELVERGLAPLAADSYFLSLWNAMWQDGAFVYVPRSVQARIPVWVAHVATGESGAVFPATVIVLEDDSSATLIDDFGSPPIGSGAFSSAATSVTLGRDARLDYAVVQQWGGDVTHIATHRAELAANSRLRMLAATFGSRLNKSYWDVRLAGEGADATLTGVCFGDGEQHLAHQSLQDHVAPNTRSDLLLKVAVRDRAHSVYAGTIDVATEAQQSDGYVQNRNLLLSKEARADTVPRLEIRANDVRCGHGATAGHVDQDQRFYLETRGIPRDEAERLIVRGFMEDALARCPQPQLAEFIGQLLDEEIAGQAQIGVIDGDSRD